MAKKQVIKLTENDLHNIIKKSVNSVLKEYRDIDDDNYYGGGLPDNYFDEDEYIDDEEATPCDGYVVEDSKSGEIVGIFRNKENAMKQCEENYKWYYWGFNFKD